MMMISYSEEIFYIWPILMLLHPYLTLDGVPLPHSRILCNLRVFMDSQLFLHEQGAALARKAFLQLHLVLQLHSFLDQGGLQTSHSCSGHLITAICLHGAAPEDHLKIELSNGAAMMCSSNILGFTTCQFPSSCNSRSWLLSIKPSMA